MTFVILSILSFVFLVLILGPCKILIDLDWCSGIHSLHIRVISYFGLFGLELAKTKKEHILRCLLLGNFFKKIIRTKKRSEDRKKITGFSGNCHSEKKNKHPSFYFLLYRIFLQSPGYITGLLHAFHFRSICVDGAFGTGNPAETGKIYGIIASLQPFIGEKASLSIQPFFNRRFTECHAVIAFRFFLITVLWRLVFLGTRIGWLYFLKYTNRE